MQEKLSKEKSLISTNEAYQLATNWLRAISVDVNRLEAKFPPSIRQRWYYGKVGNSGLSLTTIPIFDVKWGNWDRAKISVVIYGTTKELLQLRQEDDSFSERPRTLIDDSEKLLAIPDADFLKYSDFQRINLFQTFAVVKYSNTATNVWTDKCHTKTTSPM